MVTVELPWLTHRLGRPVVARLPVLLAPDASIPAGAAVLQLRDAPGTELLGAPDLAAEGFEAWADRLLASVLDGAWAPDDLCWLGADRDRLTRALMSLWSWLEIADAPALELSAPARRVLSVVGERLGLAPHELLARYSLSELTATYRVFTGLPPTAVPPPDGPVIG